MTSLAQKNFRIFFCHWTLFIFQNKDSNTSSCLVMVFYAKKTLKIALWRHKNDQWRHKICPSDVILEQNIFWTFCEHVHTKTKTLQEVVSELCPIELKHIHKISRKSLTSQLWPPSPDPHMGPNFLKPLSYGPKQKSRNLQKISSRYVNNFKR